MARSSDISPLAQVLSRADAVADGAPSPDTIPTGFPSLDRLLGGGLRGGDLTVLGGDVGSGKSAFALAIALRIAQRRQKVTFFSGEMTTERVLERVLAIEGRVKVDDLRHGVVNDIARASVGAAAVRMREVLPAFETMPAGGVDALLERIEGSGVELVVIDSLQSLARGARSMDEDTAETVRRLKTIALEHRLAIFATAQLPQLTARDDRRPVLDDFGALGAVKHHADVVLGLYREDMYDRRREIEGATELLVRKNRNGNTGYVDLYFYAQWMRFEDMLDPDR
ncbi:MAG TPA: DnaB-like helicase C-terminal domain-containing protein [Gemmatimonadaceae bacterium]|nr:DnaB-like helicase C-terminal domain-containing protein [Gemmatimonadaceae bacterium]